jgi:Raf kinase inhibitor-like YbhB/YbcL family protein
MLPLVFELTTSAFAPGQPIPARHTCTGENLSPPLRWTRPPEGTASLALVVDDPDAPGRTWLHWVAWGIPPTATELSEGVTAESPGLTQGTNDFGERGYGGPCPPPGHGAHRYFFRLYALDTAISLPAGASRVELEARMKGHIKASTELMGKFWR